MTEEEITKVAKICLTADSWCIHFSSELCEQLRKAFPEYAGVIDGIEQHKEDYFALYKAKNEDNFLNPFPNVWELEL